MKKALVPIAALILLVFLVLFIFKGGPEKSGEAQKEKVKITAVKKRKKRLQKVSTVEISQAGILQVLNEARAEIDRPALIVQPTLAQVAASRAFDMKDRDYFAETSPLGESVRSVTAQAGYRHLHLAEYLLRGRFDSLQALAEKMLDLELKDTHKLLAGYTETGIAIEELESGEQIVVQVLAVPQSACPPIRQVLLEEFAKNQQLLEQLGVNPADALDEEVELDPAPSPEVQELIAVTRLLDENVRGATQTFEECLRGFAVSVNRVDSNPEVAEPDQDPSEKFVNEPSEN